MGFTFLITLKFSDSEAFNCGGEQKDKSQRMSATPMDDNGRSSSDTDSHQRDWQSTRTKGIKEAYESGSACCAIYVPFKEYEIQALCGSNRTAETTLQRSSSKPASPLIISLFVLFRSDTKPRQHLSLFTGTKFD